jgi:hypothetical protein
MESLPEIAVRRREVVEGEIFTEVVADDHTSCNMEWPASQWWERMKSNEERGRTQKKQELAQWDRFKSAAMVCAALCVCVCVCVCMRYCV